MQHVRRAAQSQKICFFQPPTYPLHSAHLGCGRCSRQRLILTLHRAPVSSFSTSARCLGLQARLLPRSLKQSSRYPANSLIVLKYGGGQLVERAGMAALRCTVLAVMSV
ncbi:hypothetical protein CPB85DRAFT_576808 [Mucidula mucida]|nr:hypothetical protein CPB85DRAFT_576808 [Mucidula mucida]